MSVRKVAMIVAASENNVIGVNGDLPWRLSADLKRFKQLTMGHHIVMGRKTFDSIGRLLPGRTTVIVTRQTDYKFGGAKVVNSIEQAIEVCDDDDCPFITGGAEIYRVALPFVNEIHLTRVHTELDGDTFLPKVNWDNWVLESEVSHPVSDKNNFKFSFETYQRLRSSDTGPQA